MKLKKKSSVFIKKIISHIEPKRLGLFVFVITFLVSIFYFQYVPSTSYKVGDVSEASIEAPRDLEMINETATRQSRLKAASEVEVVYSIDEALTERSLTEISQTFDDFRAIQMYIRLGEKQKAEELISKIPFSLSTQALNTFMTLSPPAMKIIELYSKEIVSEVMSRGIKDENLIEMKKDARIRINSYEKLDPQYKNAIKELLNSAITPNMKPDWDQTAQKQDEKMASITPIKMTIKKGQVVVNRGEIITPQHLDILRVLGLYRPKVDWSRLIGITTVVIISIILILAYLKKQEPRIYNSTRLLLLLSIIIIFVLIISKSLTYLHFKIDALSGYLALTPIPTASILATMFLGIPLGLITTIFIAIGVGVLLAKVQYIIVALLMGIAAVLSVSRIKRHGDFVIAGFYICLASISSIFIAGLLSNEELDLVLIKDSIIFGFLDGSLATIVAIGAMAIMENVFSITTDFKLLELSNPAEPLLKRLLSEAPGTYHHSMIVANIAENAAESINANSLLTRVGAFYHDIGKIKRPYFFIENQPSVDNPHDKISPNLSTLIIISHVKDGVDLATQYKLPREIIEIIDEHHGTSVVSYFYHQAQILMKGTIKADDYRHHGPKPRSKESAIIMIADGIEAASRTLHDPTQAKIEGLVHQRIKEAIADGQLDRCDLSFYELNKIESSFVRSLAGMYHHRIEYPEKSASETGKTIEERKLLRFPGKNAR